MLSRSLQQIPHCVHGVHLMHPVAAEGLLEFSPDSICVACFPYAVPGISGSSGNSFSHPQSIWIQKSPLGSMGRLLLAYCSDSASAPQTAVTWPLCFVSQKQRRMSGRRILINPQLLL